MPRKRKWPTVGASLDNVSRGIIDDRTAQISILDLDETEILARAAELDELRAEQGRRRKSRSKTED